MNWGKFVIIDDQKIRTLMLIANDRFGGPTFEMQVKRRSFYRFRKVKEMYSDPGLGQARPRDRLRCDSGLVRENTIPPANSTSGTAATTTGTATRSPSSRETLSSIGDQFSPQQRAAYSEGEWNDDTDSGNAENSPDWELRSTVAKLKKMSLRTFRLWR